MFHTHQHEFVARLILKLGNVVIVVSFGFVSFRGLYALSCKQNGPRNYTNRSLEHVHEITQNEPSLPGQRG